MIVACEILFLVENDTIAKCMQQKILGIMHFKKCLGNRGIPGIA
jgi:hypothetical protein